MKYTNIFGAFYTNTLSAVGKGETLADWFEVLSGTGQCVIQAPLLFNIILNWILEQAMAEKIALQALTLQRQLSSHSPEKHATDINYADDLGALNDTKDGLQESTDKILKNGRKAGLQINVKKTKLMSIDKKTSQQPFLNIKIDVGTLEQVTSSRTLVQSLYVMDQ